jgi:hypothetical protein
MHPCAALVGEGGAGKEVKMHRLVFTVLFALGLALAPAAALADRPPASPPTVTTTVVIGGTSTMPSANPCSGATGTVTLDFNSVLHITDQGTNSEGLSVYHVSGTTVGTLTFVPDDSSQPSYTGHFAAPFSTQATPPALGFVVTDALEVVAGGSDGSVLNVHLIKQLTRLPSGEVVVDFSKLVCA